MEEQVLLMTRKWGSEGVDLYVARNCLREARNILREAGYEPPNRGKFDFCK
jgi:hypothetical protein